MQNRIYLSGDVDVVGHVHVQELKPAVPEKMLNVGLVPRDDIVDADDRVPVGEHVIADVAAQETRSARDEDLHG